MSPDDIVRDYCKDNGYTTYNRINADITDIENLISLYKLAMIEQKEQKNNAKI
jgi:hypothetical protein